MESLKYTNLEELTKLKKPKIEENKKTQITFSLLNEAFKNVKINTTFDGSNASIKIGNTIKKQLRINLKKIVGKPQTFEFLLPNNKNNNETPTGQSSSSLKSVKTPGVINTVTTPSSNEDSVESSVELR